jgi:hypothetical protein
MTVSGTFDLYITNVCNLHCTNCIVLDYKGRVTIPHLSLAEIEDILSQIPTKLEYIQLVGGEPTLHPELEDILLAVRNSGKAERISIVTNGTNYTPEVARILEQFDQVVHTDYTELGGKTPQLPHFVNKVYPRSTFDEWFTEAPGFEYNKMRNWHRCYLKLCYVLTKEGVYHCPITMNEKVEVIPYTKLKNFRKRRKPLDFCEHCPQPCEQTTWSSNRPKTDKRVYDEGRIQLVQLLEATSN